MFCEATAATPARACAQRAATAGEEDEMAMPKRLVRAQRAAIEKVTGSIRNDGGCVDLDKPVRPRQRHHDEAGAYRMQGLAEPAGRRWRPSGWLGSS
jgi:hypothetical protein